MHRFSPFFVGCYFYAHLVVICKLSQANRPLLADVHTIIFLGIIFFPHHHLVVIWWIVVKCTLFGILLSRCPWGIFFFGPKKKKKTKNTFLHSHHPLVVICQKVIREKTPFCRRPHQLSFWQFLTLTTI